MRWISNSSRLSNCCRLSLGLFSQSETVSWIPATIVVITAHFYLQERLSSESAGTLHVYYVHPCKVHAPCERVCGSIKSAQSKIRVVYAPLKLRSSSHRNSSLLPRSVGFVCFAFSFGAFTSVAFADRNKARARKTSSASLSSSSFFFLPPCITPPLPPFLRLDFRHVHLRLVLRCARLPRYVVCAVLWNVEESVATRDRIATTSSSSCCCGMVIDWEMDVCVIVNGDRLVPQERQDPLPWS